MWASHLQFFRLTSPNKEISYDEKETRFQQTGNSDSFNWSNIFHSGHGAKE